MNQTEFSFESHVKKAEGYGDSKPKAKKQVLQTESFHPFTIPNENKKSKEQPQKTSPYRSKSDNQGKKRSTYEDFVERKIWNWVAVFGRNEPTVATYLYPPARTIFKVVKADHRGSRELRKRT